MKYCFCSLLFAGLALAQSDETATAALLVPDLNGNSVLSAVYTANDGDRQQLTQSINGRTVPLQQTETHVLSKRPNGQIFETVTRKYDPTGQLVSTERTVVDQNKIPNGQVIHAIVYRSDLNGQMPESERRTVETQTHGTTTSTGVTISRPGLSGAFDVAEKRDVVTVSDGKTVHETELVQVPAANGQLMEVAREVRDKSTVDGTTTSTAVRYEPDFTGKMSYASQQVTTVKKASDGSLVTQVDIYAQNAYGIARSENGAQQLKEQEVIVRREKNGVVTETTTVSRPTLQDRNRLSPAGPPSEVVCTGKCEGPLKPQ